MRQISQDMGNFMFPILLKQQHNGFKTNQTNATVGQDAATS
jgi:hypothetical protein